ncbi:MAG TPA: DUF1674 domain-containing protein [Sphingobium sp.]
MKQRPDHLKPPAYLTPSTPVPEPETLPQNPARKRPAGEKEDRLDPIRYGDWEQNGIAVDF